MAPHILLDVAEQEIVARGHAGPLYGIRGSGCSRAIVVASTSPATGLELVAYQAPHAALPQLVRENGEWFVDRGFPHPRESVAVVPYSVDYGARQIGLTDPTILGNSTAALLGLGSLGLPAAMHLVRAGVGRLILADGDTVELENLCRSGYTVDQLGMPKVDAAAELLVRANPRVRVTAVREFITPESFTRITGGADIVIGCASSSVGFLLAAQVHATVPLIIPALYARAAAGEVFISLGAAEADRACFSCFRAATTESDSGPKRATWNYDSAGELAAEPGLGPDVTIVASIAAALAVNVLAGTPDRVLPKDGGRLLLVANRNGSIFESAYETKWVRVPRHPACPNHAPSTDHREDADALMASIPEVANG